MELLGELTISVVYKYTDEFPRRGFLLGTETIQAAAIRVIFESTIDAVMAFLFTSRFLD